MAKGTGGDLKEFLSRHEEQAQEFEELETINLERDQLHTVTIHGHHTFEGKFGLATVITYENENGKAKTYLGGFEVTHFNSFIEGKELPLKVNLARIKQESKSNDGRTYNRLVIEAL